MLLPLRVVSRCVYNVIIRILHDQLIIAVSSKYHTLVLECYHPSAKSIEPHLFCNYIDTPGLSRTLSNNIEGSRFAQLRSLYSHFRPIRQDLNTKIFRRHPAGEVPGSRTSEVAVSSYPPGEDVRDAPVSHNVNLEPDELFSQLCVATHRAQLGPHRGIIYSIVNVTDSVVRIWRQWLAQRAKSYHTEYTARSSQDFGDGSSEDDDRDHDTILWVDDRKDVGIRIRIRENSWKRNGPILLLKDEDPAISYTMELEGTWRFTLENIG